MSGPRPFWRRLAGALLIVYGAAGFALVAGGALLVSTSVTRLDGLASTLDTQRQVLLRSLDATSTFLRDARSGTGNVQVSLTSTVDSARQAASLAQNLGAAMTQLASASSISILGSQPFAGLGGTFTDVARQSDAMGTSLARTADSLAVNGTDLSAVSTDLSTIETELTGLRAQLSESFLTKADIDAASRAIEVSRVVLLALLVWLAAQALIAIAVGIALLRWSSQVAAVDTGLVDRDGLPLDEHA